jgi:hypothetical protein
MECGVMSRTKIKNDDYICSTCDDMCSQHIRKSRFTKEELAGHMEYMKRSDRIYKEVIEPNDKSTINDILPHPTKIEGIHFFDDYGMFRICHASRDRKPEYPVELFRYDQVAGYEPYLDEREPSEPGKPMEFRECGIKLTLVGGLDVPDEIRKGAQGHPYITDPIKVPYAKSASDKEKAMHDLERTMVHFDNIFGVHDDRTALFSFGMSKKEKRDLKAGIAFANTFIDAVKVAKNGADSLTEDKVAEIQQNMDAMADAQTGGLAVYTRRANEAEAKIN